MELEPSPVTGFEPAADPRPRMPEPLPVRLVSVDDVRLPAPAGRERELDAFYVLLLGFEREDVPRKRPRPSVEPLLGGNRQGPATPPLVLGLRSRDQREDRFEQEQMAKRVEPAEPAEATQRTATRGPDTGDTPAGPVYRAENFRLRFQTLEPPVVRETLRAQGIEVRSLAEAESRLIEAEIEYVRERGLVPGRESLVLQDPAGNWVELVEAVPA